MNKLIHFSILFCLSTAILPLAAEGIVFDSDEAAAYPNINFDPIRATPVSEPETPTGNESFALEEPHGAAALNLYEPVTGKLKVKVEMHPSMGATALLYVYAPDKKEIAVFRVGGNAWHRVEVRDAEGAQYTRSPEPVPDSAQWQEMEIDLDFPRRRLSLTARVEDIEYPIFEDVVFLDPEAASLESIEITRYGQGAVEPVFLGRVQILRAE